MLEAPPLDRDRERFRALKGRNKFGVRRQSLDFVGTATALWIINWQISKAVSRSDHPSAAAALGTPVLATALQISAAASRLVVTGHLTLSIPRFIIHHLRFSSILLQVNDRQGV